MKRFVWWLPSPTGGASGSGQTPVPEPLLFRLVECKLPGGGKIEDGRPVCSTIVRADFFGVPDNILWRVASLAKKSLGCFLPLAIEQHLNPFWTYQFDFLQIRLQTLRHVAERHII